MVGATRAMAMMMAVAFTFVPPTNKTPQYEVPTVYVVEQTQEVDETTVEEFYRHSTQIISEEQPVEIDEEPIVEEHMEEEILSREEIELLALVTMAEAEGESDLGKRLVIDTVLNRVDHDRFPDSVHEVIYQKNQFTSMTNGRVDRCYVREDICQLVKEELRSRTNRDVVFFTAGNYGNYGTPMFQEGNHYFASY